MTNGELIDLLIKRAQKYYQSGIAESIIRDNHMNELPSDTKELTRREQIVAEAAIVGFINFAVCGDVGAIHQ